MTKENNVDHSTDNIINNHHEKIFGDNRSVSFEQYEKMLKSYRHLLCYASQEMRRCKRFLDEAFTKYPNSNSNNRKLKDFEIHESRNYGLKAADDFVDYCETKIEKIERVAKQEGVEIIKKRETFTLGETEIPIQNVYDKEGNNE